MIEEYTGIKKQVMRKRERFYAFNILPEKLNELIRLNPEPFEEMEENEKRESQSNKDVKTACGIKDPKMDKMIANDDK